MESTSHYFAEIVLVQQANAMPMPQCVVRQATSINDKQLRFLIFIYKIHVFLDVKNSDDRLLGHLTRFPPLNKPMPAPGPA
ncbi:MAG TPA: hypothetical protein VFR17_08760 [Mycobacterium sp.]|nr:hypothetical protein [Mycobacterium sp.]